MFAHMKELELECDYRNEAANQMRMRTLLRNDRFFSVPRVLEQYSTGRVLTTELVKGQPLEKLQSLSQDERDEIGRMVMLLCLNELFVWRFMQVDPNWSNFLYDPASKRMHLLDFGACLSFDATWVSTYLDVILASSVGDTDAILKLSVVLGYLTGQESQRMQAAHCDSVLSLGLPFRTQGPYAFGAQTVTKVSHGAE
jgi:aarF domain-containing kinase